MALPQILQQLGMKAVQSNPNFAQIKNLMNAARGATDSEAIMQQMIANNPKYQQAYTQMKEQGESLKEVFMNRAQELGVDANEIINMLK